MLSFYQQQSARTEKPLAAEPRMTNALSLSYSRDIWIVDRVMVLTLLRAS